MSSASKKLSIEDRLLMTLLRLRRGWDLDDIGLLFGVGESTASKIVYTWLQAMWFELKRLEPAMFVSRHVQKDMGLPPAFTPFHNFRVILDTTEVRIEAPEDFREQGNTFSDYKGGNVLMYLIGSSCWGSVSYVSPGFEGSISDVELYRQSGIRDFLEEGDLLLVDRGFRIQEECDEDKVICVHPPFLKNRDKYTPEEEQLKREIAKARIYVEHVNRKIKVFKILKNIRNTMLPYLDQIVYVISFLVNLQTPHVKTTLEKMKSQSSSD
ncbi:putative transposase for insertion sequence element IS702 [Frankliniella fusca]|uniref:Transposase for insertion sequence element IS702 n=1 Tax=Frankliniella fusca TaxID=407009 RepID=A0AAE1HIY3_9NEOP|nr:putative transposase for insertion sequence element IS702 [Frankliniella fusca]